MDKGVDPIFDSSYHPDQESHGPYEDEQKPIVGISFYGNQDPENSNRDLKVDETISYSIPTGSNHPPIESAAVDSIHLRLKELSDSFEQGVADLSLSTVERCGPENSRFYYSVFPKLEY